MSAVYLARLLSCSVTDPQPYSFSSSTHADSSSLHSSGWEQLGGSHVPNTLLMCTSREITHIANRDLSYHCVHILDVSAGSLYSFE